MSCENYKYSDIDKPTGVVYHHSLASRWSSWKKNINKLPTQDWYTLEHGEIPPSPGLITSTSTPMIRNVSSCN